MDYFKGPSSGSTGRIGFVGLLQLAFIVLKLVGKINWNWIWVLSPIWISVASLLLAIIIVAGIESKNDK